MKIGLLVGSLRKDSWNRKIANVMKELFPKDVEVQFIEIGDVPFYNPDLDGPNAPEAYKRLRAEIKAMDAFLFFTPEYNRSVVPALKNALDVASVGPDKNLWAKKAVGVVSASMGALGGALSNMALRQTFVWLNMIPMQQPEVYLSRVDKLFENGALNEGTRGFLQTVVNAYLEHVKMVMHLQ